MFQAQFQLTDKEECRKSPYSQVILTEKPAVPSAVSAPQNNISSHY